MHTLKPGWKMVKFGDVVHNIAQRIDPADAQTDVYVGLEHLEPDTLHLRQWGHPSDVTGQKLVFKKGDVIFGRRRAYQRKLALAECDGICSAHAMVIRAKQDMILPEFLPFFLQSDMFMERAVQISVGSLSPTINWKTLKEQMFPLPPLEEQKRLAELLWAADEAVEKWNITYADMEYLLQTTRNDIFQKFSQTESHVPLKNIGHWVSGATPSRARKDFWNGSFPWVSPKDMKYDTISDSQEKITDAALTKRTPILPKDSILIVVRGMILAHTFPVARTLRDVTINQDMKGIIPSKYFLCDFIFHWFKNNDRNFLKLTEESTHGTKRISTDILFSMNIPKPPLEEQKKAVILLNRIMNEISAIKSKIDISILLKKKLYNNLVGFSHV